MKSALRLMLCLMTLLGPLAYGSPCPTGGAKDEATLIRMIAGNA